MTAKGTLCPYDQHAPDTEIGWLAAQLAEMCLMATPAGLQIDIGAALATGLAQGAEAGILADLLDQAQAGVMSGLAKQGDGNGGS